MRISIRSQHRYTIKPTEGRRTDIQGDSRNVCHAAGGDGSGKDPEKKDSDPDPAAMDPTDHEKHPNRGSQMRIRNRRILPDPAAMDPTDHR